MKSAQQANLALSTLSVHLVHRTFMQNKEFKPDSVVQEIVDRFLTRAEFGKAKYGTDLDRQDLDLLDWITHFREEMMDGLLYITRIEHELRKKQAEN